MRDEEEFIRGRVKTINEIAALADPFVKERLKKLADSYERRLKTPTRPPMGFTGLETKMAPER